MKNNKGFMLVEVIITSTVILTGMIGLYTTFNKLYKNYNIRNNYYNIDGNYATREMFNNLMGDDFNKVINNLIGSNNYDYLIKNGVCNINVSNNKCLKLMEFYGIDNMIFALYDKNTLDKIDLENETFDEYLEFVIKYYEIDEEKNEYDYLFLTEMCNEDNCYYSNLRVR